MAQIPIGAKGEQKVLVTPDIAIDFLGHEGGRVLATPHMIMLMEMTCRNLIKSFLEDGFDSVGTEVNVKHLAATPIGMSVTFTAEVLQATDKRVLCRVEAHDEREKIGEGTHERAVINVARFASRLASKLAAK
jgi:fluoroacetyl-CoA thioesterase